MHTLENEGRALTSRLHKQPPVLRCSHMITIILEFSSHVIAEVNVRSGREALPPRADDRSVTDIPASEYPVWISDRVQTILLSLPLKGLHPEQQGI